jgi:hypothetical protein
LATQETKILKIYKKPDVASLIEAAKLAKSQWPIAVMRRNIKKFLGIYKYKKLVSWKKSQRYKMHEHKYQNKLKCNYCNYIASSNYNGLMTKHLKSEHKININNIGDYKKHCVQLEASEEVLKQNIAKEVQCILCEKTYIITDENKDMFLKHMLQKHHITEEELYFNWPTYKFALDFKN